MFAKIKEDFLCYLERRKWAKFKKTGLQKLPPPTFEYSDGLGWLYALECSRVNESGQFITLYRYPNGSVVDESVRNSVTQVINEEKRVGGSLFGCN